MDGTPSMDMKKPLVAIPVIVAVAAVASFALYYNMDAPPPAETMTQPQDSSGLSGTVDIGLLLPLTGDLASHGEEDHTAARLAVDDFNEYLAGKGSSWSLNGITEDTNTNPVVALEKITALNARDVNVIVGPAASANIRNTLGYITSNNIILISCCSTAPALAIEGDNVFRMVPDDNNQGPAIADLMASHGIEAVVPVWRADAWGDGLKEAAARSFSESGGMVDDGIRYNPESPEFSASTSLLADKVQAYADQYGADKVGVLMIAFAESLQFMQSASAHEVLDDVRWFGSDANTNEQKIVDDPIGREFAQAVGFTTMQFAASENPVTDRVKDHVISVLGRTPSVYAYTSYDAVWVAGLAIEAAQSTDTDQIRENIIPAAEDHSGAVGSTKLNAAGDLDSSDYAVWTISDGAWIILDSDAAGT